jgi:hypothetical protein
MASEGGGSTWNEIKNHFASSWATGAGELYLDWKAGPTAPKIVGGIMIGVSGGFLACTAISAGCAEVGATDAGEFLSGEAGGIGSAAGDAEEFAQAVRLAADNPAVANRGLSVADYIAKFRQGSVLREFPGEFLNQTVEDALRSGNATVRKLLISGRWAK